MNTTTGIFVYALIGVAVLAFWFYYISRLRREAPEIFEVLFRGESKAKHDWRLLVFILKGRFQDLPNSLKYLSRMLQVFFVLCIYMLFLIPAILE
jgi:hypothetical protein